MRISDWSSDVCSSDLFDNCVDYIVELLDEAVLEENLPASIEDRTTELGRITKPIALTIKALVLTTAASPLFNGNPDYDSFADKNGVKLFNSTYDPQKWERAAQACKRSEERRVGKEGVRTCRSRSTPSH